MIDKKTRYNTGNSIPVLLFLALLGLSACSKKSTPAMDDPKPNPNPVVTPGPVTLKYPVDSTFNLSSLPAASAERDRLNQTFLASDFIPSGWYALPGSTVKVNLKRTKGSLSPTLIIGTYNRGTSKILPQEVFLTVGDNIVSTETGGLIYIRYSGEDGQNQSTLKFNAGVKPVAYYKAGVTTKEQWKGMLTEYNDSPDAILRGGKITIVLSRTKALDNVSQDQEQLLANANRTWDYEDEFSGLDGSSAKHKRNVHGHLMTESDDDTYYMAAYNYGTFYNRTTAISTLFKPADINTWGPWHEMGHHHQQNAYKWTGLTEVTVNLYSLYMERKMGTPSRLKSEGVWPRIKTYMQKDQTSRNFDDDLGLFDKLAMFQQLTMAYGDNFYIRLHKETREELPIGTTDYAKKRYFMMKACTISGNDLTDFFKSWGMVGVDAVYPEIATLKLSKPTVNPATLSE